MQAMENNKILHLKKRPFGATCQKKNKTANNTLMKEKVLVTTTINHRKKHSQKSKKEKSTCQLPDRKNQHYAPRCCTYLGDEKKKKNSYLQAMVGCPMPCPRNNGQKEWEQSTTRKKATPRKTKKNNQPVQNKKQSTCQLLDQKQNQHYAPGCFM